MEAAPLYLPSSLLRGSYERARSIPLEHQVHECVDLLSHPQLLESELLDAYEVIESFGESELDLVCQLGRRTPSEDAAELVLDHFYPGQEVTIETPFGPDLMFRSLATDVRPVADLMPSEEGVRDGFDYIAEPGAPGDRPSPTTRAASARCDAAGTAFLLR